MKTKDVLELFDSSVRKLKKIYGTEAMNVSTARINPIPKEHKDSMAFYRPTTDWEDLTITKGMVAILPSTYLYWCDRYRLDEEAIKFSIMGTACHEMAHHLHFSREVKSIRNEYVHDKKVGKTALKLFFHEVEYHGVDWARIMIEEMGSADVGEFWKPSREMPKIFVR